MKRFEVFTSGSFREFVKARKQADRRKIESRLEALETHFHSLSDYTYFDSSGRLIDVTLFDAFAIHYWIDSSDHHIKVMRIELADRNL